MYQIADCDWETTLKENTNEDLEHTIRIRSFCWTRSYRISSSRRGDHLMIAAIALALVIFVSMVSSALAIDTAILQPHKSSVSVCSKKNSDRCVNGPIKTYSLGQKVRLPGGTWVDCAGDCREKLRTKTVDFWYDKALRN